MPEGPELHLMARFVHSIGHRCTFGGKVLKSEVSTKNPNVEWTCERYKVAATSRGKEMKIFLTDVHHQENHINILFHFGMSGKFMYTPVADLPKHAHLQFYTHDGENVLSFVDYRRFGRWFVGGEWGVDRGPCFISEYELFRSHILDNVHHKHFDQPICEVLLDQRYFNGVGNYIRAEALYRLNIKPFTPAKEHLLLLLSVKKEEKEIIVKNDPDGCDDLLSMLHKLGNEVVQIGLEENGYYYEGTKKKSGFAEWLQCYNQEGMSKCKDSKGRTMWYTGEVGHLFKPGVNGKNTRTRGDDGENTLIKKEKLEEVLHRKLTEKRVGYNTNDIAEETVNEKPKRKTLRRNNLENSLEVAEMEQMKTTQGIPAQQKKRKKK